MGTWVKFFFACIGWMDVRGWFHFLLLYVEWTDKTRQDKTDELCGSKAQLYWDVIGVRGGVLGGGLVALVA